LDRPSIAAWLKPPFATFSICWIAPVLSAVKLALSTKAVA
jgi:hypothetical protein